jgi:hypothetical protein
MQTDSRKCGYESQGRWYGKLPEGGSVGKVGRKTALIRGASTLKTEATYSCETLMVSQFANERECQELHISDHSYVMDYFILVFKG